MYFFSYFDLLPWIFLLFIVLYLYKRNPNSNKSKKIFYIIWFFCSIRYGIGYDYFSYKEGCLGMWPDYSYEGIEPLARNLMLFCGKTLHYQVFFIVTSFLCLYPVYKVSNKASINPTIALVVYLLFPNLFLESLSTIRNSVAFSLVLYSFYLYNFSKNKLAKYISFVFIVIAMGFHMSAIVGFLIYPLSHFCIGKKYNILFWISSFFIGAFISSLLVQYLGGNVVQRLMAHMEKQATGGQSLTYAINLVAIINFIFWKKISKENNDNQKLLTLVNVGICFWNMFLFIDSTLALRISSFFTIFMTLLYANTRVKVKVLKQRLNTLMINYFAILFIILMLFQVRGYLNQGIRMGMMPFQTIFYYKDYENYY